MGYATTTALQTLMIGTNFDTATTALGVKLITHAENEINKYLSKRYDMTAFTATASVPPMITSWCETLAEGYMCQRMSRGGKEAMARGQTLIDQVIGNLKLVADYKLDLVNTAGSVIADMSNTAYRVLCNTTNYANTFNEDDPNNWEVSDTKLDDIDTEREE